LPAPASGQAKLQSIVIAHEKPPGWQRQVVIE
jgi:hypothetical protein